MPPRVFRPSALLLPLLLLATCTSAQPRVLYDKQSEFNRIIVEDTGFETRQLLFEENGAIQSSMDLRNPASLVLPYTRAVFCPLAIVPNPRSMLIVGLGGGIMPAFLRRNYPEATIDIAELDPDVAKVAARFFSFREDAKMKVHIGDGRKFIETTSSRYDIIFLDAYGSDSIPYSLATREFLRAVRSRLSEGGMVVSNVWGSAENRLYPSMLRTYEDLYPEVHIIRAPGSQNRIIIALPKKLNLDQQSLIERAQRIERKLKPAVDMAEIIAIGLEKSSSIRGGKVLVDADPPKEN